MISRPSSFIFFFFNDTATTEIYTLSLHDALPISAQGLVAQAVECLAHRLPGPCRRRRWGRHHGRSEEHTSELQSHSDLVCRLLLEKKKEKTTKSRTLQTSSRFCTTSISEHGAAAE